MIAQIAENLHSFYMVIGGCKIVPPSAKAALLLVMWFYGVEPGVPYTDYEARYGDQLLAAGATPAESINELKRLDKCFASYVVPPQNKAPK